MQLFAFGLAAAVSGIVHASSCTAERRIGVLKNITAAFNEKDFAGSLAAVDAMPLAPDCTAFVAVDGLPGIEFGLDATTSHDFSNVVRQVFTNVDSKYADYGNGTSLLDAIVTLGVLHYFPLPVYAHIVVPIEFDMETCEITKLPAAVYVPVDILGHPIDPLIFPSIPGLSTLPPSVSSLMSMLANQGFIPNQLLPEAATFVGSLGRFVGSVGGLVGSLL